MSNKEKFSLEQALSEASVLSEKVEKGEAKDYPEADLQFDIEQLMQDPEAVLQKFANTLFTVKSGDWRVAAQFAIKTRLNKEGNPSKGYLNGLRKLAGGAEKEREIIITAAYLYELRYCKENQAGKAQTPTLFRAVLEYAKEREGLLGQAMRQYLKTVSLQEIYANFKDFNRLNPEDMPMLADLALSRLETEKESANEIINDAMHDLFKPLKGKKVLRAEVFIDEKTNWGARGYHTSINAERYSIGALNALLAKAQKENPEIIEELVNIVDEKLYSSLIPLDEKEFHKYVDAQLKTGRNLYYVKEEHEKMVAMNRVFQRSSILSAALLARKEKRDLEAEQLEEGFDQLKVQRDALEAKKMEEEKKVDEKRWMILFQKSAGWKLMRQT